MNVNDLYAIVPEDMHGIIAVSDDVVSITQDGENPPFILFKSSPGDNPELVFNKSEILQVTDNPTPPPAPRPAAEPDAAPASEPVAEPDAEPDAEPQAVDPTPNPTPDIAPPLSVFQRFVKWVKG